MQPETKAEISDTRSAAMLEGAPAGGVSGNEGGHGRSADLVGAGRTGMLLMLCFILAQADQQVMGLLAVPIQEEFGLSNSQLGLLQGFAFSMAYAVGGLPLARLLDGGNRIRIVAVCVALWSLATMLCGLANSFLLLLLLRAVTAVTEAGLPPAAFSIFSQSGDGRRAARMTSMFMLAPFIGGGLVWLLGGMLLGAIPGGVIALPGWSSPWRAIFLAVGLPGLILAPLLAIIAREPPRAVVKAQLPGFATVLKTVFVESRFLRYYFAALTAFYMLSASVSGWFPAFLVRAHGLTPAVAGAYAGGLYLAAGVLGVLAANARATFRADSSVRGIVGDLFLIALLLVPVSLTMTQVAALPAALALYGGYAFLSAMIIAVMAVPIQLSLATQVRARGIALSSFCMSAFAGSIGPLLVGVLADRAHFSLSTAMTVTGGVAISCAVVLLQRARRHLAPARRPGTADPVDTARPATFEPA